MALRWGLFLLLGGVLGSGESLAVTPRDSEGFSRVVQALQAIGKSPSGRGLIQKASLFWKESGKSTEEIPEKAPEKVPEKVHEEPTGKAIIELAHQFQLGKVSHTDTVLTRHFNPSTGVEEKEREIIIHLRENQTQEELTLDLSHELVHATARPAIDPYDPSLTPGSYIWRSIEGEGGEVDAVEKECRIGFEIFGASPLPLQRCQNYLNPPRKNSALPEIDRLKIKRDFYKVGHWREALIQKLGDEIHRFPLLSSTHPVLYSSTGLTPYPYALFLEFQEVTDVACQNSRERVKGVPPSPLTWTTSNPLSPLRSAQSRALEFLESRCNQKVILTKKSI